MIPSMSRKGNCWDNAPVYYNAKRLHSTLGYKIAMDYEKDLNKVSEIS